jgi:hypothetical protein
MGYGKALDLERNLEDVSGYSWLASREFEKPSCPEVK